MCFPCLSTEICIIINCDNSNRGNNVISRKITQKSNIAHIGIFEGKEAEYNKQILEILFKNGSLTTWEIAKKIREKNYPISPDIETKAHRIYSVIQRKNGRLRGDLEPRGYANEKGKKWELALKGITATLILNPDLISQVHPDYLSRKFESGSKEVALGPFKIEPMAEAENAITPQFLSDFAKKTGEYLKEGLIDLDIISEDKLAVLVYLGLAEGRCIVVREESRAEGGRYAMVREKRIALNSEGAKDERRYK